jgi:hypothetical protein
MDSRYQFRTELNFALFQNGVQTINGCQKSIFSHYSSKTQHFCILFFAFCNSFVKPQFMEEKLFDRFKMAEMSQNGRQIKNGCQKSMN